jgi:hypothetical protein
MANLEKKMRNFSETHHVEIETLKEILTVVFDSIITTFI